MTTAREIVDEALSRVGAKAAGETPAEHDRDTAFAQLVNLISMLSIESVLLPYRTKENFSLAAGLSSVTIGDTGDLATNLPHKIERITIRDSSNNDYHLNEMSDREYSKSYDPSLIEQRPTKFNYETSYPNGTILFNNKTADAETLYITSLKEVSPPINISSEILLPAEYITLLKFNLPVFISDFFPENNLSQVTIGLANASIASIKNKNLSNRIPTANLDSALLVRGGVRYNVNED